MNKRIIDLLFESTEPSIQYKIRTKVIGEQKSGKEIQQLLQKIKQSPRVATLLNDRDKQGYVRPVNHVYQKWMGAHWVFATLADIGYPAGEAGLFPLRDQVLSFWLKPERIEERAFVDTPPRSRFNGVPIVNGRARRCASQQGNGLWAAVTLGLVNDRCHRLAECLIRWQWPDGGWNCDIKPVAETSSFWESLIPLRALSSYAKTTGNREAADASKRAAEIFLQRRLFQRKRDGSIMNPQFLRLHYPCYWRYDILFALKVMAEAGFINDPRCHEALDVLMSKRLPDGGWPAEERFYSTSTNTSSGQDRVDWGGVNKKHMNEWITADALFVLKAAGRLDDI